MSPYDRAERLWRELIPSEGTVEHATAIGMICSAIMQAELQLHDAIRLLNKCNRDTHEQRDDLLAACERVMEAIAGHTNWHPSPEVDTPDWNPNAHVDVTLTVADCRALKAAIAGAKKAAP